MRTAVVSAANGLAGFCICQTLAAAAVRTRHGSGGAASGVLLTCPPVLTSMVSRCLVTMAVGYISVNACNAVTSGSRFIPKVNACGNLAPAASFCSCAKLRTSVVLPRASSGFGAAVK